MRKLYNIYSKYPNLFKETISINCGDGWYWLIDNLCASIDNYIGQKNSPLQPFGFDDGPEKKIKVNITYIKEKFGMLNVFYDGADDTIHGYVSFACYLSTKICENCGTTKYIGTTSGWVRYLCMNCGEKDKNDWSPNKETEKEIRKDKLIKIQNEKENSNN